MLVAALVLAGVAALLHVYIFVLESLRWTQPRTREIFGTTRAEAETTRTLAFNQGFYNLFLAVVTVAGIVLAALGSAAGPVLLIAGTGSMLAAALVLVASSPARARAAAVQGTAPLLTLLALLLAPALG